MYLAGFIAFTMWPIRVGRTVSGLDCACLHLIPAFIEGIDSNFHIGNEQVYGNFLAGVPFGFALPFLISSKTLTLQRRIFWGCAFSIAPEFVQFIQNVFFTDFMVRTVDIDDVWLCFAGTQSGYVILYAIARLYRQIKWPEGANMPIWSHFHNVLLDVATRAVQPSDKMGSSAAPKLR